MLDTNFQIADKYKEKIKLEEIVYTEEQLADSYNSIYNRHIKRLIDILLAIIGLLSIWPVLIATAIAVVVDTGFPIFYRPLRGGYQGKPFRICKYRTMIKNADKLGGGTTGLNDRRITPIGAILRKTKLDETIQLINVLCGTMSFVGPRPELLQYTNAYEGIEKNILNVRPGITDFSSINFVDLDQIVGSDNPDEIYEKYILKRKNQLRLKYVAEVSFKTDVKIFWNTIIGVFKNAFKRSEGNSGIHKTK